MPLFKFKVMWQEDDNIQRDIEILSNHSFFDFHTILKKAFTIKEDTHGSFYVSDEYWEKGQEISSKVDKNIKGAPALSCVKTPIGALVRNPHQAFLYVCDNDKAWTFLIELIILAKHDGEGLDLPRVTRTEGLSPADLTVVHKGKENIVENDERYDLESKDGFGDEDDEGNPLGGDEESTDEGGEEFGNDFFEA